MNMKEVRAKAKEKLKGWCRVCPQCDGRACAGEMPGMGGTGTGRAFMENVRALEAWQLNLRTLHKASEPDTSLELWGERLDMPVMGAPLAGAGPNLGDAVSEVELAESMHAGCREAGTLCWSGDGVKPEFYPVGLEAVKTFGRGIPTIKPREPLEIAIRIRQAEDAGATAVAIDVDAAGFLAMGKMGQPVGPISPVSLGDLLESTSLPVILKGIMTADEASLAATLGVAGIVVSNHGGRVLDACPGTADVLPEIAAAVRGRMKIFLDGGIRSGSDVLKALALGADAVLVGRPLIVAAVGGGKEGVALSLRSFKAGLVSAMILTGVDNVRQVPNHILRRAER